MASRSSALGVPRPVRKRHLSSEAFSYLRGSVARRQYKREGLRLGSGLYNQSQSDLFHGPISVNRRASNCNALRGALKLRALLSVVSVSGIFANPVPGLDGYLKPPGQGIAYPAASFCDALLSLNLRAS